MSENDQLKTLELVSKVLKDVEKQMLQQLQEDNEDLELMEENDIAYNNGWRWGVEFALQSTRERLGIK